MTDLERFQLRYLVDIATGCWIWQGGAGGGAEGNRYGMFRWNGKNGYAHRFAYEVWRGSIPKEHTVDHRCRVTLCCNPFHLEAVLHRVNVQRGANQVHPVVVSAANRHCRNGHWLDEANTYNDSQGFTRCRQCNADRMRDVRRGRPRKEVAA